MPIPVDAIDAGTGDDDDARDMGLAWIVGAGGTQLRSMDVNGRLVDAASETPTARAERIEALQTQRIADGHRTVPDEMLAGVLNDLWRASASARMAWAKYLPAQIAVETYGPEDTEPARAA